MTSAFGSGFLERPPAAPSVSERGQAMVEFALVLPFILVLALAIVELADAGVARLALAHAAAEGARIGALTNDDALVRSAIDAAVAPLDPASLEVRIAPAAGEVPRTADPRGSLLRVELAYPLPAPLAFAGLPRLVLRGSAARLVEWTP